eukprot:CAMPEP_0172893030 /NCGR_PEP_ID=MMETSP1075-20121228/147559_1 /TAXON_ID=2916 /ORGANISM="Ceratium fusus, Strain PA161109" /LENGTH=117 /DNA_ID=CAMNT_0013747815 /DNA_START=262 /DNA_END=615 /DNA_ORIENTATION=-
MTWDDGETTSQVTLGLSRGRGGILLRTKSAPSSAKAVATKPSLGRPLFAMAVFASPSNAFARRLNTVAMERQRTGYSVDVGARDRHGSACRNFSSTSHISDMASSKTLLERSNTLCL